LEQGNFDLAKQLISLGADTNACDNQGATPLHKALQYGKFDVVQLLVEQGADVNSWNARDSTPLHMASEYGHLNSVKVLLNHGADMKARDSDGSTPMHYVSIYGHVNVVQHLINVGADKMACDYGGGISVAQSVILWEPPSCPAVPPVSDGPASSGWQVLNASSPSFDEGHIKIVEELLQWGADINARDNDGLSPLWKHHHTARTGLWRSYLSVARMWTQGTIAARQHYI